MYCRQHFVVFAKNFAGLLFHLLTEPLGPYSLGAPYLGACAPARAGRPARPSPLFRPRVFLRGGWVRLGEVGSSGLTGSFSDLGKLGHSAQVPSTGFSEEPGGNPRPVRKRRNLPAGEGEAEAYSQAQAVNLSELPGAGKASRRGSAWAVGPGAQ